MSILSIGDAVDLASILRDMVCSAARASVQHEA